MLQHSKHKCSQWRIHKPRVDQRETISGLCVSGLFHLSGDRVHGRAYIAATCVGFCACQLVRLWGNPPAVVMLEQGKKGLLGSKICSFSRCEQECLLLPSPTHPQPPSTPGVSRPFLTQGEHWASKLCRMEGASRRCGHLLHVPFFPWAWESCFVV